MQNRTVENYVLCVITGDNHIAIMEKSKGWQSGLYNFPGGKIEYYDSMTVSAAIRETREETGLDVYNFEHKGHLIINDDIGDFYYTKSVIHIFYADIGESIRDAKSMTDEKVLVVPIQDFNTSLYREKSIGNIHAIYDLIKDGCEKIELEYRNEV